MQAFKKIEAYGFKSFADRLEVDFSGGITCIVGPNGCGKSNISDAVRWVLGEQSSKILRGTNMQDVIFKGTEKRSPLGYCEVSLHFDNGNKLFNVDYSEVVITRKLFKSGESEYQINRQQCRLKDITHLLHDCGIDRDGLTIISQGQVSDIITQKPELRRGIFEEAAGIARFKHTKVEAERKLERTQADLDRVYIVIGEIERNLAPLLKQAKAAEQYVVLQGELKNLEINAFVTMYDNAAGEKEKIRIQMTDCDNLIKGKQTLIVDSNRAINEANAEIDALDKEAGFLREQVVNLSVGVERETNNKKLELYEGINILKQERAALLSKKRTIENLIESGEGYKFSVRKLMETKNRNIVGVVAKELNVPEHLEAAIEVALGAAAQNIITNDEQGAKQLIEYIRDENFGRATFLPLTAAKVKLLSDEEQKLALNRRYVLGVASDLVKYKAKIQPVVQALLGRTIVVDGLDNAIELVRDMGYSAKVVTLDGDVIETRGSITGGSKSALNNNLWHNNNLALIEEGLTALEKRITTLENQATVYEMQTNHESAESAKLVAVRELVNAIGDKKYALRAQISEYEQGKLKLSDEIASLTQNYYRHENALGRIDVTTEQMQIRMDEEYQMNYSACHMYLTENNIERINLENMDENIRRVSALKRQVNALGPVNLDAIEQSKSAKDRFDDYSTQVADLEKAKSDLQKVIKDLDGEMVNKFRDSFEAINKNFGEVFKELFGGGHARLNLVPTGGADGGERPVKVDWLKDGIDIIAEPAGKKLANLTLLSGGEKALTAIALLFAILKHKTMPFCILDEIEAALDEANVARFANYLQNFSATTQFIVITHRKGTMELANNLYGITMEEPGVSKIVSVKLENWTEENGELIPVNLSVSKEVNA